MPNLVDFELKGFENINKLLKTLPGRIERRLVRRALRSGASVVSKRTKQLAPKGATGNLRRSIAVKMMKREMGASVYNRNGSGMGKFDGWYAHIIEKGSKRHRINLWKSKSAKKHGGSSLKKVLSGGGKTYGTNVNHPGTSARPFMVPALEQSAKQALSVMGRRLAELLEKEIMRK